MCVQCAMYETSVCVQFTMYETSVCAFSVQCMISMCTQCTVYETRVCVQCAVYEVIALIQVRCVAYTADHETFDLSSLTLLDVSHTASVSPAVSDSASRSSTFYINVCHPVARQHGVQCPLDAAVCRRNAAGSFVVSTAAVCLLLL